MRAFTDKGRLGNLVSAIPVHVVTINAALLGAADLWAGAAGDRVKESKIGALPRTPPRSDAP